MFRWRSRRVFRAVQVTSLVVGIGVSGASSALADFTQQGPQLSLGSSAGGASASLSADGNTAVVGVPNDSSNAGAAFVFTRSGTAWTAGPKLVGTGAIGAAPKQGSSVAISADGNTIVVGAIDDDYVSTACTTQSGAGAAWVFTKSGNSWTQQAKLIAAGTDGRPGLGWSVALSSDGNTAIVGGRYDGVGANSCGGSTGAAWVFVRSGATWTQQGAKLQGVTSGDVLQGNAVALSADGNIAAVGGPGDGAGASTGAVWIFTRASNTWTQQTKLVAASSNFSRQGWSAALSNDGATLISGGFTGNSGSNPLTGAAYVFTRSGTTWSQQGGQLVGTGSVGPSSIRQGHAVGLAGDGNTAVVAGFGDDSFGASWVFVRSAGAWTQQGAKLVGTGGGTFQGQGVAISGDGSTILSAGNGAWVFVQTYPPTTVLSAVLPASRSVQVGTTATAFGTIINTGSNAGVGCGLSLGTSIPATFSYQTTNPATNALTGTPNTPATIGASGNQSYVFAITPSATIAATDVIITAKCSNSTAAPSVVGLNTLLLSASATPVPDIVALAASTDPGYVDLPGNTGSGAFSVATVNVGAAGAITASADTGSASLPVTILLCQTNAQAVCSNPAAPAPTVNLTIAANATPTFSIFVTGSGNVTNDPANNRVFVRFKDAGGVTRGSTSVAVRTQ